MLADLLAQNAAYVHRHAPALRWQEEIAVPNSLTWLHSATIRSRAAEYVIDNAGLRVALHTLFGAEGFPAEAPAEDLRWLRDSLGKPYVEWHGEAAEWGIRTERDVRHLHVSNTHDGEAHLLLAAYSERLIGVGIDVVHLTRLRTEGKGRDYLLRFANRFMSPAEREILAASSEDEGEAALRTRIAAHFSLMEAASKAVGTGLRIGVGMGKPTSLSPRSLGVSRLESPVTLSFEEEAQRRLNHLGATRYDAYWGTDNEYLVSVVLLW